MPWTSDEEPLTADAERVLRITAIKNRFVNQHVHFWPEGYFRRGIPMPLTNRCVSRERARERAI